MQFITITDYLLLPFYLIIVFFVAYQFRNSKYPIGHPWRPYFLPALTAKIIGALFIGMIYQYYYGGGGDTTQYFRYSTVINSAFTDSPVKWVNLIFRVPEWYNGDYINYISQMPWYTIPNNYTVGAFGAIPCALALNAYLPTAVMFAVISFTGIWAMFRTFATLYPTLVKHLAITLLFIPSTLIWGSGIFKDTICMFSLGWIMHGAFTILINRKIKLLPLSLGIGCFYLVAIVKIYILAAFMPALALWLLFQYAYKIKDAFARNLLKIVVIVAFMGGFSFLSAVFSQDLGQYSLDNIAETSITTNKNIVLVTADEGSAYDLGSFDPSIAGMLKKFPLAVNVSLFRPYLWEAKNPLALFNALEATLILLFTLKLFATIGPRRILAAVSSDPNIQFFLIFSVVFAFAVGLSSGNFGTLSRYRIPCLPPYTTALMLIYYKYTDPRRPFWARQSA